MDDQNRDVGSTGGMGGAPAERTGAPGNAAAGSANTPSFGGGTGSGSGSSGKTETEREMERTRDMVAQTAGPVVAEKMQEAVQETSHRLEGQMGDQMRRTATAAQHDAKRMAKEKVGETMHRAEDRANRVMDRAADGLESAAHRLDDMANRQGGQGGATARVGDFAHQAADTMESTARYLRDNDVRALQSDLERMVREKPLQTLLIGVAAGWVLGKILR